MFKKLALCGMASAMLVGCEDIQSRTDSNPSGSLESWRARTILGGGANNDLARNQGRVVGGQQVKAGEGTIFPGRQPLVRDSDFADDNGVPLVTLNLVGVTIEEAATAVLGELLSENYVIDPGVSGSVNIRSSEPVSRTTAIEVFEIALRQNNAALVRRGDTFAIVPITGNLALSASTSRQVLPGYTIRVIPLRNIAAQEMAAILQPFAGDGIIGIDAQRNILVLAGTSVDQRSWQETITSFDVDWLANKSVGIFPVRGRSAQSIINGLERVVETGDDFEPLVVFEVIPENNSILAVAKTPRALENTAVWIKRLTQEGANDAQIFSYDMKYARASDIAPTLADVLGIAVSTTSENVDLDEEVPGELMTSTSADVNATRIVASEATNTLLIRATDSEYKRVLGILHRLDVPPRQVLVEATIVEVTLENELEYGVQYFLSEGRVDGSLSTGGFNPVPSVPGFNISIDTSPDIFINALEDTTDINIVSSPNLMILNNESARLVVGDQVPITTTQSSDFLEDDGVLVETVEFRDTGVIFEVTPRINSSGTVVLNINQEVSSVGPTDADTLTPTISQRVVNSSIAVDSGETIVLGGLFSQQDTRGNSGIPILKDIPVAGKLFSSTNKASARTELLVLITPRIVNSGMDSRRLTSELRNRVRSFDLSDSALEERARGRTINTPNSAFIEAGGSAASRAAAAPTTPAANTARAAPVATTALATQTAAPKPTAVQPASAPATGSHVAVLGSFSSQPNAKRYWDGLAQKNPGVLNATAMRMTKDKGLYVVAAGPTTQAGAKDVCVKLRVDCFVAKAK